MTSREPSSTTSPVDRRGFVRAAGVSTAALGVVAALPTSVSARTLSTPPAFVRSGRPVLTHGVQAGDVFGHQAQLWTRADRASFMMIELSRDADFRRTFPVIGPLMRPGTDFTGQKCVLGLPSGADIHYRIKAVNATDWRAESDWTTGRFHTIGGRLDDIRFLWSGDIAGQGWGVNPDFGGFRIANAMAARNPDFFLCSGDNVYADGPVKASVDLPGGGTWRNVVTEEKSKVAETLDEFRGQFRYNLLADNWREFLATTSHIVQWDDHEVVNNWYPGEVLEDDRYTEKRVDVLAARALRAFHDYMPVAPISPDPDGRVYRKISQGPMLDLFILDMRTHKNPNSANDQSGRSDGGVLGEAQTQWLIRELQRSRATWKIIANDLPLGLVVPDGSAQEGIAQGDPGLPLGRERDIARVLKALKDAGIRNHVWLTADVHYTAAHHYSPERASFTDFDPFWEFVSGPLNAGAFGPNALDGTFGPRAEFIAAPPRVNASPAEGFQFFGEVTIDARTQQLTVELRDVDGVVLHTTTIDPERR